MKIEQIVATDINTLAVQLAALFWHDGQLALVFGTGADQRPSPVAVAPAIRAQGPSCRLPRILALIDSFLDNLP